jgi:hypothetical protein
MRGRKSRRLTLSPADVPILHGVAHSRRLVWFQVQQPASCLALPRENASPPLPPGWNVIRRLFGASAAGMNGAG